MTLCGVLKNWLWTEVVSLKNRLPINHPKHPGALKRASQFNSSYLPHGVPPQKKNKKWIHYVTMIHSSTLIWSHLVGSSVLSSSKSYPATINICPWLLQPSPRTRSAWSLLSGRLWGGTGGRWVRLKDFWMNQKEAENGKNAKMMNLQGVLCLNSYENYLICPKYPKMPERLVQSSPFPNILASTVPFPSIWSTRSVKEANAFEIAPGRSAMVDSRVTGAGKVVPHGLVQRHGGLPHQRWKAHPLLCKAYGEDKSTRTSGAQDSNWKTIQCHAASNVLLFFLWCCCSTVEPVEPGTLVPAADRQDMPKHDIKARCILKASATVATSRRAAPAWTCLKSEFRSCVLLICFWSVYHSEKS